MRSGTIAFLVGVVLLQTCAALPSVHWCWSAPAAVAALRRPRLRLPAAALLGFLWALLHGHAGLDADLPAACEGEDLEASGVVVSIPEHRAHGLRFVFRIDELRGCPAAPRPLLARLGWYSAAPHLRAGQHWTLRVRLKRRHGFLNPGGFDYERWLFLRGIGAVGYVRAAPGGASPSAAADPAARWAALRHALYERIAELTAGRPHAGTLLALSLGERAGISQEQWRTLARTGTGHLLAISGLHVGLVAGLGWLAGGWLWSRIPWLSTRLPARQAGAILGLALALVYAGLAGFALPTRRAVLMLAVATGALLLRRQAAPSRSLAAALLLVLLFDPLAVLSPAFWLSFGAVAVLVFGMSDRLSPRGWWWRWGRAQWLVGVGLLPLTLGLFQQAALVGPAANLIAVPWVGLLVTPLALGGAILAPAWPGLAAVVLALADRLLQWLWPLLEALSGLEFSAVRLAPSPLALVLAGAGVLLALAPRGLPGRPMSLLLLLPLLAGARPGPTPDRAEITILDVGQGLAAVVRVGERVLVYDSGPRYSATFDAGRGVIAPYLRTLGVRAIDRVILSHGDSDHSGGYASLADEFSIADVVSGQPEVIGPEARPCRAGERWRWHGTEFRLLHPPALAAGLSGNDASCVLRLANGAGSLLLTGDLQARGEALLLAAAADGTRLRSSVLVAPHHGSATSSTPDFVAAVRPKWVLFSTGYRNRFGFPRPEVMARYAAQGARMADTADCGAVQVLLDGRATGPEVVCHRAVAGRYWNR